MTETKEAPTAADIHEAVAARIGGKSYPASRPEPETERKPFKPVTQRQRDIAGANKRKLDAGLASIHGFCLGLARFQLDRAIAGAEPGDIANWEDEVCEAIRVLRKLQQSLKEAQK